MLKEWTDGLDMENPLPKPITERTRASASRQRRWLRGSVRLTMGNIVTDRRYRELREKLLRKPL